MEIPSSKVVFATLAALLSASAVVIGANGVPTTLVDVLKTVGAILAIVGSVGGVGYRVNENRPASSSFRRR